MNRRELGFYVSPLNSLPEVKGTGSLPSSVVLRDVTLREGEQASAVSFTVEDKVEIARQLDDAGFPQIEVGFGEQDREAIGTMKRIGLKAQLSVLVPAFRPNWQKAIDTSLHAGADIILVLFRSSEHHMKMLNMDREQALKQVATAVGYAVQRKAGTVAINTSFATMADPSFLKRIYRTGYEAGASNFGIADSTGVATPETLEFLVRLARGVADVPVSVHVHDDFGLAVANSLAAIKAGASIADVSVLGLGERAGNAAAEQLAVALEGLYGVDTGIQLDKLQGLAQTVARISGVPISSNKAVVGPDVFAQKLEMHVEVTTREPALHEPFAPELVGHRRVLKLGSGSGPVAVKAKLSSLGLNIHEGDIPRLVEWVNQQAVINKRDVSDGELEAQARKIFARE